MSKIAVTGSRSFSNNALLDSVLNVEKPTMLVSGGAQGADTLAREYASKINIQIREYLPEYRINGKYAPLLRNKSIVDSADKVIAFWDGKSKGTRHTINYALKSGKPTTVYDFSKTPLMTRSAIIGEPHDKGEAWSKYLTSQKGVGGAGSSLKANKRVAALLEPSERFKFSYQYVQSSLDTEKFKSLSGKDNIYLLMPSSSGNMFPRAIATILKEKYGGTIVNDFASQDHSSGIKNLYGVSKVLADRSYTLRPDSAEFLRANKDKNIVMVDDLISTGGTIDALRRDLNKYDIKVNSICSLVMTSTSLASSNSISKLSEKVFPDESDRLYREKMQAVFHNSLGGVSFHIQRSLKSPDDVQMLREYIDKSYKNLTELIVNKAPLQKIVPATFDDVRNKILSEHSLILPDSILKPVYDIKDIDYSKLTNLLSDSINSTTLKEYSWSNANGDFLYSQENELSKERYLIRCEGENFKAYKSGDSEKLSYLGSDNDIEALKNRVEKFCVFSLLRGNIEKNKEKILTDKALNYSLDL